VSHFRPGGDSAYEESTQTAKKIAHRLSKSDWRDIEAGSKGVLINYVSVLNSQEVA